LFNALLKRIITPIILEERVIFLFYFIG